MGKEILTFGNVEIGKNKSHCHKTAIFWGDVDIEKLLLSKNICFGEKKYKYFIGYLYDNLKVKPLKKCFLKQALMLKKYDGQTKWMYFLTETDDLLEKYNPIWNKVSADMIKRI